MSPTTERLCKLIDRIREIDVEIDTARKVAAHTAERASKFSINCDRYGNVYGNHPVDQKIGERLRDMLAAEIKREEEARRDAKLKLLASELEGLRSVLCDYAARSSIDLGVLARGLVAEATQIEVA